MATRQEAEIRELAKLMDEVLEIIYGQRMGFFLCVSPFGDEHRSADYISNSERASGIRWMKETIERFEKREEIPVTEGEA